MMMGMLFRKIDGFIADPIDRFFYIAESDRSRIEGDECFAGSKANRSTVDTGKFSNCFLYICRAGRTVHAFDKEPVFFKRRGIGRSGHWMTYSAAIDGIR